MGMQHESLLGKAMRAQHGRAAEASLDGSDGEKSSNSDEDNAGLFAMELDKGQTSQFACSGLKKQSSHSREGSPGFGMLRSASGSMDNLDMLLHLAKPSSYFEQTLRQKVAALKNGCKVDGEVDLQLLASQLTQAGFAVHLVDGHSRPAKQNMWHHLRHAYLVCVGHCPDGHCADGCLGMNSEQLNVQLLPCELIIDIDFRDRFEIVHSTYSYDALVKALPLDFVGTRDTLKRIVKLMCEQMALSFKYKGLPLPPWRTYRAVLSMWSAPQSTTSCGNQSSFARQTTPAQQQTGHAQAAQHQHPFVATIEMQQQSAAPFGVVVQHAAGSAQQTATGSNKLSAAQMRVELAKLEDRLKSAKAAVPSLSPPRMKPSSGRHGRRASRVDRTFEPGFGFVAAPQRAAAQSTTPQLFPRAASRHAHATSSAALLHTQPAPMPSPFAAAASQAASGSEMMSD